MTGFPGRITIPRPCMQYSHGEFATGADGRRCATEDWSGPVNLVRVARRLVTYEKRSAVVRQLRFCQLVSYGRLPGMAARTEPRSIDQGSLDSADFIDMTCQAS